MQNVAQKGGYGNKKIPAPQAFKLTPQSGIDGKQLPDRRVRFHVDWESLDWSQPNIRLSECIGCTREFIRRKRAELGKPKLSAYEKQYREFVDFLKGRDWATPKDFAHFGIRHATGRRYLLRAQKKYKPTPRTEWRRNASPRSLMNWELPNRLLDEIWAILKGTSATWRSRMGMQRASFRAGIRNVPERFAGKIEAERKKAKEWNSKSLLQAG